MLFFVLWFAGCMEISSFDCIDCDVKPDLLDCVSVQVSWFAVGCYYLLSGRQELAQRYLSKSTSLDRVFGPAWLAYGHSFAAENEHDQAMAAYFTASQLMKG